MRVSYLVITILAAIANGYAALLNFVGAESVKVVADRVQRNQRLSFGQNPPNRHQRVKPTITSAGPGQPAAKMSR
jgi:hypothetical protein